MSDDALRRVVILGGGTAGWMTANLMAHRWQGRNILISVIESPEIGIIGVGEGSTPTLRRFFSDLEITEAEWMPACNATYKASIRFEGWSPGSGVPEYSHPFITQLDTFTERPFYTNCRTRRLGLDVTTDPGTFLLNGWLAEQGLAPLAPENFPFRIEYGYHFDSGKLGEFLRERADLLGVSHLPLEIEQVTQHEDGRIKSLIARDGTAIDGDFFVDCSGFRGLLIQQTLGVSFDDFSDNLFNDRAIALPTTVADHLPVETRAEALSAGWMWRIPLTHRTGNGYVYSSQFLSDDEAETELRTRLGLLDDETPARRLAMRVGQVAEHWHKNCLALGLSGGFIEPLEATALHLVQTGAEIFLDHCEQHGLSESGRRAYNRVASDRFERVRDYIVAHYKLNTRDDSEYWRANRSNMKLSESLLQILDVWFRGNDLAAEISRQQLDSHFGATSWHCLLAGYGTFPPLANRQPGEGDLYQANGIEKFFRGCCLNFQPHSEVLSGVES
jgi:glycine/D-amino acid oxidase-like deaminating enzyme